MGERHNEARSKAIRAALATTAIGGYIYTLTEALEEDPPEVQAIISPAPPEEELQDCDLPQIIVEDRQTFEQKEQLKENARNGHGQLHYKDSHRDLKEGEWSMEFDNALALATCIDELYRSLPQQELEVSPDTVEQIAHEYITSFSENGFVDYPNIPDDISVTFENFENPSYHDHVLGLSNCVNYIKLNGRFDNPFSAWYRNEKALGTLIHEWAHIQQSNEICENGWGDRNNIENTAQIMMLEVLAAMANQGNEQAFKAFVGEMRKISDAILYVSAYENKKMDEYREYRRARSTTPFETSAYERWQREQDTDIVHRINTVEVSERYNSVPFRRIMESYLNQSSISDLALPEVYDNYQYGAGPKHPPRVMLDDFWYTFEHMNEMAQYLIDKNDRN